MRTGPYIKSEPIEPTLHDHTRSQLQGSSSRRDIIDVETYQPSSRPPIKVKEEVPTSPVISGSRYNLKTVAPSRASTNSSGLSKSQESFRTRAAPAAPATKSHLGPVMPQSMEPPRERPIVNSELNGLNRELWDLRRELTTLRAREDILLKRINAMDPKVDIPSSEDHTSAQGLIHKIMEQDVEIQKLKEEISWSVTTRNHLKHNYDVESKLRRRAEGILQDMRQESHLPLLLPAVKSAFEQLSELTGEALDSKP